MKHYLNNKIYNTGDTVIIDDIQYINCTDKWFKNHNSIEVIELQDNGNSGLYTVSEKGDKLVPYTGQTITKTESYTDEEGNKKEHTYKEEVPHKYFLYLGKPLESKPYVPTKDERIIELKQKLSETDYCVIKIAEGVATKEEYTDILKERANIRKQINELEDE